MSSPEKLSYKEIYRMMIFEYRQELGIPITKIAESVTKLYYPFKDDHLHKSLKTDITNALKNYSNEYNEITEEKFCEVMKSIENYSNEEYHKKFLERIFKRYDKNKDGFLEETEFYLFIQNIFTEDFISYDAGEIFNDLLKRFKVVGVRRIDFETFLKIFDMDFEKVVKGKGLKDLKILKDKENFLIKK